jgi:histidine triad (HIT) family protein
MSDCLFCNIVAGKIPATAVFEDDEMIAIHDLHPQAPTHLLIIPKRHIATINDCDSQDDGLLGRMILVAKTRAAQINLSTAGYRLVFNVNSGGGQEIYHIHLHVLGGRQMTWPPG